MEYSILPFVRRHVRNATLSGLAFAAIGFAGVFLLGPDYSVRTDYLVSQENAETKDYYTLTRSAEYMSRVLTEVTGSERFISAVAETGKVDQGFLPQDKRDRLIEWKRMVLVGKKLDLGIISVTVRSDDVRSAQKISLAITQVFTEKNGMFLGTGDRNVPVSVLSGPISERNPSLSRVVLVVIGGFGAGCIGFLFVSFLRVGEVTLRRGGSFQSVD